MANLEDLRKIVSEEVANLLNRGVGRSVLASKQDSKGVWHVYELFLGAGLAKHLGPSAYETALRLGVPNIGNHGDEVFDRFSPVEGHWAES